MKQRSLYMESSKSKSVSIGIRSPNKEKSYLVSHYGLEYWMTEVIEPYFFRESLEPVTWISHKMFEYLVFYNVILINWNL